VGFFYHRDTLILHGNNRTNEIGICVICHNPNATDIEVRPTVDSDATGRSTTSRPSGEHHYVN
jgi:hypothetical protein